MNKKTNIVLIDDDKTLLNELDNILTNNNFLVNSFTSTHFINHLENINPDIFIIDIWFNQNSNGITQVKAIHQVPGLRNVPIILISSDPQVAEYAESVKVNAFIKKPFEIDNLIKTINSLTIN